MVVPLATPDELTGNNAKVTPLASAGSGPYKIEVSAFAPATPVQVFQSPNLVI